MRPKNMRIPAAGTAIALSAAMIFSGCGVGTTASSASDTIYGQITSTDDDKDTITLNVGTVDSDDNSDMELSGKSQTIKVSGNTKYTSNTTNSNNGQGGAPSGAPSGAPGGAPGQQSSGNTQNNNGNASLGQGQNNSSGQDQKSTSEQGQKSSSGQDQNNSSGQPGNGDGNNSQSENTPPEKPENTANTSSTTNNSDTSKSNNTSEKSSAFGIGSTSGNSDLSNNESSKKSSDSDKVTFDSLKKGTKVAVTLNKNGKAKEITVLGTSSSNGQDSDSNVTYTSANEISNNKTLKNKTIQSTGTDEEAILVDDGATAKLKKLKISRTSDDSTGGGNASFYGVGASVLTTDGTTYLSDSTITSDSKGGAGVFSYGSNSTTYVADTKITTKQDESGGIHVAGGGKLYAYNVTAETSGGSSAAIRSDRGGGTLVADGGSYTSNGSGSPAIYSTADITVHDADLTANGAEAACIEGKNSIRLFNCNLTGNMPDDSQNDNTWNVILYQSMSGDSEEGNSTFEMVGGTLTAKNGGMFYSTNTQSTFILDDVDITYADENDYFLKVTGNSNQRGWGSTGSNGADTTFTAIKQEMQGNIIWDSISQLDFYMTDGSTLKGAIVDDESNAGNGGSGYANLYIEKGSTWTVTGDSTLTNLYNAGTIQDADGNLVTIKGTDGTVYVQGTSQYTITVTGYSTNVDLSGASSTDHWSDYAVKEPTELK